MSELEKIYADVVNKQNEQKLNYINSLKEQWEHSLIKIKEIYDKLSFIEKYGNKIYKEYETEFDYEKAVKGYFPNVRVNNTIMIKPTKEDDKILVSSLGAGFPLGGITITYEQFLKKLI
jgi:ribosomal protein L11 methylase PrmA